MGKVMLGIGGAVLVLVVAPLVAGMPQGGDAGELIVGGIIAVIGGAMVFAAFMR